MKDEIKLAILTPQIKESEPSRKNLYFWHVMYIERKANHACRSYETGLDLGLTNENYIWSLSFPVKVLMFKSSHWTAGDQRDLHIYRRHWLENNKWLTSLEHCTSKDSNHWYVYTVFFFSRMFLQFHMADFSYIILLLLVLILNQSRSSADIFYHLTSPLSLLIIDNCCPLS